MTELAEPTGTVEPTPQLAHGGLRARPRRTLFESALFVSGCLLWAYVVFGELVVEASLPEVPAALLVIACGVGAAIYAGRRGLAAEPAPEEQRSRRFVVPALAAVLLVAALVFAVSLLARASGIFPDGPVTVLLLVAGVAAAAWGRNRLGGPSRRQSTAVRVVAGTFATLAALLTLLTVAAALS